MWQCIYERNVLVEQGMGRGSVKYILPSDGLLYQTGVTVGTDYHIGP